MREQIPDAICKKQGSRGGVLEGVPVGFLSDYSISNLNIAISI